MNFYTPETAFGVFLYMLKKYGVLILAAGFSQRMGQPKFLLPAGNSKTFLEKIVENYSTTGAADIVVVVNKNDFRYLETLNLDVKPVINESPEKGRFYSVVRGLENFDEIRDTFIHNADNPFVFDDVLINLANALTKNSYAVPVYKGKGGHPVLISKEVAERIVAEQNSGYNLKEYLKSFNRINVQANRSGVLVNINTPDDYKDYINRLKTGFYD